MASGKTTLNPSISSATSVVKKKKIKKKWYVSNKSNICREPYLRLEGCPCSLGFMQPRKLGKGLRSSVTMLAAAPVAGLPRFQQLIQRWTVLQAKPGLPSLLLGSQISAAQCLLATPLPIIHTSPTAAQPSQTQKPVFSLAKQSWSPCLQQLHLQLLSFLLRTLSLWNSLPNPLPHQGAASSQPGNKTQPLFSFPFPWQWTFVTHRKMQKNSANRLQITEVSVLQHLEMQ